MEEAPIQVTEAQLRSVHATMKQYNRKFGYMCMIGDYLKFFDIRPVKLPSCPITIYDLELYISSFNGEQTE